MSLESSSKAAAAAVANLPKYTELTREHVEKVLAWGLKSGRFVELGACCRHLEGQGSACGTTGCVGGATRNTPHSGQRAHCTSCWVCRGTLYGTAVRRHATRCRKAAPLTHSRCCTWLQVLDTVRPYLINDGGNVELVALDASQGKVALQFQGACSTCPSSQATLQLGCVR
jgi:Fe-S cluster biogenesis protein NfuA